MTTSNMVALLNEFLDTTATTTSFWTLNMFYAELSAGQREVASILHKKKSPKIQSLLKHLAIVNNYYIACPDDFMDFNAAEYAYDGSSYHKCDIKSYDDYLSAIENPYKTPGKLDPIVYLRGDTTLGRQIYFYPTNSTTSNGKVVYIANPTDIGAATEPVLPQETHNAIVTYAKGRLLDRDKRTEEAAKIFKEFYALVEAL